MLYRGFPKWHELPMWLKHRSKCSSWDNTETGCLKRMEYVLSPSSLLLSVSFPIVFSPVISPLYPRQLLFHAPNPADRATLDLCMDNVLGAKPCSLHVFSPLIIITTPWNRNYLNFIGEETETQDLNNRLRVTEPGSERVGIWTQLCLMPKFRILTAKLHTLWFFDKDQD